MRRIIMKNISLKKFIFVVIILLLAMLLIIDIINSLQIIRKYPQITIHSEKLLKGDTKALLFQEDGSILSESEDPWVYYVLPKMMSIKEIKVITDSVNPEGTWSELFFILDTSEWIYQNYHMYTGTNKIKVNGDEGLDNVLDVRFDLLCASDTSVKIDRIIINDSISLTFKYHVLFLIALFVLFLIALLSKRFKEYTWSDLKEIPADLWSGYALVFLLLFFAPLDLYINNKGEFWFDIYKLFPVVLIMLLSGILSISLISIFLFIVHKKVYRAGVVLSFILLICSYVQGNYLTGNLPPLDGTTFSWKDYSSGHNVTIILWCIVVAVVFILFRILKREQFYSLIRYISAGMMAVLLLTLGIECITQKGCQDKLDASVTTEQQFEMSQDKNFIILILDALESDTFNDVMKNHPEYKQIFSDFTYYANTTGAYPFTSRSIPFMLSGEWFENEEPFENYVEHAYKDSPLLSGLKKEGYKLDIYEPDMPITDSNIQRFENVMEYDTVISSYIDFILYELKLTGFKYAPFELKKSCVINTGDFKNLREEKSYNDYPTTWFSGYNTQFYEDIREESVIYTEPKCFKFIHIEGAHVPFQYDKDVNVIENGTYEQNIEASITITNAYLEKLKNAGVYDNSVIMVMADHGYNWTEGYPCARQNPILMVKGINEKHEMHVSDAPISYDDLQTAYMRLLDGESSDRIFDWQEGDKRERRFLMYTYLKEDFMTEYVQTGEASDITTIYPTGREFNR